MIKKNSKMRKGKSEKKEGLFLQSFPKGTLAA